MATDAIAVAENLALALFQYSGQHTLQLTCHRLEIHTLVGTAVVARSHHVDHGIVIVIAGFALKLDSILVILVAAVVTALVGGLGPVTLLETLGSTFVANRSMAIFIIVMLVTGTLERNGLREAAAALIGKFKGATSGLVIGIYGVMRSIFAAFNVGFGGVAGFVRPVIMPMAEGAIVAQGYEPNEEHVEELKGMASGMENITWFFGQVLFVGGSGGLLVQSTLAGLGIEVELAQLAAETAARAEEEDDDDCCCGDDDCYEIECPNCGETICVDDGILEDGSIDCPNCGTLLEFDFDDDCCCGDDDCDCDHDD